MTEAELKAKHKALQRKVAAGIRLSAHYGWEPGRTPIRLAGITALSDHAALVQLLVRKGLITTREYLEAIVDGMDNEVHIQEAILSRLLGREVTVEEASEAIATHHPVQGNA